VRRTRIAKARIVIRAKRTKAKANGDISTNTALETMNVEAHILTTTSCASSGP
jgi:hypothetical protein